MAPIKEMKGTGAQARFIDLHLGVETYQLNLDEARALHRELGRMIANIEKPVPPEAA